MKTLFALAAALLLSTSASQAGWGWGAGWGGGYCGGPGWGGWGWGGPAIGFAYAAPVYRTVYVAQPAPYYGQRVVAVPRPASTLVRAQAQLASLGYYQGAVDGSFGPLTSRAIAQYQVDYRLPVTGRLDRSTLKSLRL